MSRYWPHAAYAEDQPLSHAILVTHVLSRAVTTGALIGGAVVSVRQAIPRFRPASAATIPFARRLLLGGGTGALITMGVAGLGIIPVRMHGREEIEWQDRSWRLLENQGQVECDDWTYGGIALGSAAVLASSGGRAMGWRAVVGGASWGSVVGMVGYLGWRYGVNGGKFPAAKNVEKTSL